MRLLFIQFKRLGDVLMVTPAVKALKASYPQATLHYLVPWLTINVFRTCHRNWCFRKRSGA